MNWYNTYIKISSHCDILPGGLADKKEVSDFLGVHRTTILHHVQNYLMKQNSKEKKNINVSIK